ncbi:PAS domain S-box protein [Peribacillus kribbensis]|uniref:PAS domain S-box protein n=1 Tax=Peribacillus kribbensis TaxID=356658 RepID=UPI00047E5451|nr:PAS domain S-box protein [Peribacillus kribbensis]
MTFVLTMTTAFAIFRLLIQFTNEESFRILTKWKYIGCFSAGTAIVGTSLIMFSSIVQIHGHSSVLSEQIVPFIFVMAVNFVLMLVLDLVGDKILMKNVQSYTSLFSYNPGAVLSVNLGGYILDSNKAATDITGFRKDELKGIYIGDLFEEATKTTIFLHLTAVLDGRITNLETQVINKQGHPTDIAITAVRTIINNNVIGAFGIFEDITDKKGRKSRYGIWLITMN